MVEDREDMKLIVAVVAFGALINILPVTTACDCPSSCNCTGQEVVCTDVTSIPACFPNVTTELTIQTSPDFEDLDENSIPSGIRSTLVTLRFISVGLKDVDKDAFKEMDKLKTLIINDNHKLDEIKFVSDSAPQNLETLNMASCVDLEEVSGLSYLTSLKIINFTNCKFNKIYDSTFQKLYNLEELYLNNNKKLEKISDDAFKDLGNLQVLRFDNSSMDRLQPSYFYYSNNLKQVNVTGWNYYCKYMCSMTEWLASPESEQFREFAMLGFCFYYPYDYLIKSLPLRDYRMSGCGLEGWAIFGICIGCILGIALLLAIGAALISCIKKPRTRGSEPEETTPTSTTITNTYAAPSLPMGYGSAPPYSSLKEAEANNPPPTYADITTSQA